jgi:translation initiation factor IF-3
MSHGFLLFVRVFFKETNSIATAIKHEINEQIRDKEVRLVAQDGTPLGIMGPKDALKRAIAEGLDLVKVSPTAKPPVCKIMDYGKFKFDQQKREKEQKKASHAVELKEIKMSPSIGQNDFDTKLRNGKKFISSGDRLKVTVRFRGREMTHLDIGRAHLLDFAEACSDIAVVDKAPNLEGKLMSIFLSPKPALKEQKPPKTQTAKEAAPAEEKQEAKPQEKTTETLPAEPKAETPAAE